MPLKVCLAGAAGHVGRELTRAILDADDIVLVSAVGRKSAGKKLSAVTGEARADILVYADIATALKTAPVDVLIDYTRPDAVKANVRGAIEAGCHVVIGTSGLTDADYAKIDAWATRRGVGVFAAGNFSLTAALLQHFAVLAAAAMPHWEILDYAADSKPDAPSGTARELAYQLGQVMKPVWQVPVEATQGLKESRGASLNGSQMHSIRLPGYYSAVQAVFGSPGERLELRHESTSYAPYVAGTLLAVRRVHAFKGLKRGMGTLLGL
ncbi:MAG TPA: 4-hydroxy-tetrahydrodipicolinate reductase [Gammaproteobacteria bacterium]|nr:4-hydroxy-tetrahydrodipicolinate reductase [Gammaproteobacteria bacterium]